MLTDILQELNESRFEKGRGSKAGREKFASKKGTKGSSVKARKSRVKVYDTIEAALDSGAPYGTIFSTKSADRLYVITKPTWGDKSRSGGNTRVAKGFTPGSATPAANWPSIKSYGVRTMLKHGKTKSKRLTAKYGPGKSRPEEKRFAGKKTQKKKKLKEAHCPASKGKLAELLPLLVLLKRTLLKKDHTEHEGPSLSEDGFPKKWRKPPRKRGATQVVVPKRPNLTPQQIQDLLDHIRRGGEQPASQTRQAAAAENASTEYVGTSLAEQAQYIDEIVGLLAGGLGATGRVLGGAAGAVGRGIGGMVRKAPGAIANVAKTAAQAAPSIGSGIRRVAQVPGAIGRGIRRVVKAAPSIGGGTKTATRARGSIGRGIRGIARSGLGRAFGKLGRGAVTTVGGLGQLGIGGVEGYRGTGGRDPNPLVSHTEYEGPSLREQIKYLQGIAEITREEPREMGGTPRKGKVPPHYTTGGTTGAAAEPTITYGGGTTRAPTPAPKPTRSAVPTKKPAKLRRKKTPKKTTKKRELKDPYKKYPRLGGRVRAPWWGWRDLGAAGEKVMKAATHVARTWQDPHGRRQAAGTEYEGPSLREQLMYLGEAIPMVPGPRLGSTANTSPGAQLAMQGSEQARRSGMTWRDRPDFERRFGMRSKTPPVRGHGAGATGVQVRSAQRTPAGQQPQMQRGHAAGPTPVQRTYARSTGISAGRKYEGPSLREKIKYLAEEKELTNVERRALLKKRYDAFKKEQERLDVTGQEHESKPDIAPVDLPLKGKDRKRPK